jgi:phage terminase small subunit
MSKVASKVFEEFLPPADLSESSKALWRELIPRRARSPERITLVGQALRCLDRCAELRRIISEEGLITETPRSGCRHANPAVGMLAESERMFGRLWRDLAFSFWPDLDGRGG